MGRARRGDRDAVTPLFFKWRNPALCSLSRTSTARRGGFHEDYINLIHLRAFPPVGVYNNRSGIPPAQRRRTPTVCGQNELQRISSSPRCAYGAADGPSLPLGHSPAGRSGFAFGLSLVGRRRG